VSPETLQTVIGMAGGGMIGIGCAITFRDRRISLIMTFALIALWWLALSLGGAM